MTRTTTKCVINPLVVQSAFLKYAYKGLVILSSHYHKVICIQNRFYHVSHIFSGNGYISTDTLKEILKELDNKLTDDDLENIIEEVDEDGSGTLDFDEFMEMMAG